MRNKKREAPAFREEETGLCETCGGGLIIADAFKENGKYYHPDCAGVWECPTCGMYNEDDELVCVGCGEDGPTNS